MDSIIICINIILKILSTGALIYGAIGAERLSSGAACGIMNCLGGKTLPAEVVGCCESTGHVWCDYFILCLQVEGLLLRQLLDCLCE